MLVGGVLIGAYGTSLVLGGDFSALFLTFGGWSIIVAGSVILVDSNA